MASDEHGQHKDVYAHTLQVLDQAIDLEDDGRTSFFGLPRCCMMSASQRRASS